MRVIVSDIKHIIYEGSAVEVILPGYEEELSVLDFHQPFLYALREGNIRILNKRKKRAPEDNEVNPELNIPLTRGVARMLSNELMITVESNKTKDKIIE